MAPGPISPIPGNVSLKVIQGQGWNAALQGFKAEQCPYYASSAAAVAWLKGYRS